LGFYAWCDQDAEAEAHRGGQDAFARGGAVWLGVVVGAAGVPAADNFFGGGFVGLLVGGSL
jgi:hypothetical protein